MMASSPGLANGPERDCKARIRHDSRPDERTWQSARSSGRQMSPIRAPPPRRFVALFREQRQAVAVDDLDSIALLVARLGALCDGTLGAVVELDRYDPVALLLRVFFDLVPGISSGARAEDRRRRVAASRADLMSEHAADDAARDKPCTRAFTLLLDVLNRCDHPAGPAGARRRFGRRAGQRLCARHRREQKRRNEHGSHEYLRRVAFSPINYTANEGRRARGHSFPARPPADAGGSWRPPCRSRGRRPADPDKRAANGSSRSTTILRAASRLRAKHRASSPVCRWSSNRTSSPPVD